MEDLVIEQPNFEPENIIDSENNEAETQNGSIFGKFKNANNLLSAYNSLQAEFTRKSQKLSEFQKKLDDFANFKQYENIDDFINDTTDSDKYKKEITEILVNDNEINSLPNKYQVAFKIIKESNNKLAENLNNQEFLDKYIYSNESIKNKIIEDYLSKLNNVSTTPKIVSGVNSNIHFSPNPNSPKTIKEAGEILSKMLK